MNDLDGVHVDERNEIVHGVSLLREPIIERIAEDHPVLIFSGEGLIIT